jgi:phenolic acid decarboxylase
MVMDFCKYNGYKFSAVLCYGNSGTQLIFIKNDKWKTVTLLIQASFNDILFQYKNGSNIEKFIDRCLLYTINDIWAEQSNKFDYTDKPI